MALLRRLMNAFMPPGKPQLTPFPEENLLSTAAEAAGYFITRPGHLLKDGRYKIMRKLGRGRCSTIFLVEDLQCSSPSFKYLAAKILSVHSTDALRDGLMHEVDFLQAVADLPKGSQMPNLPIMHDHFAQRGCHGVHYCFLLSPLRSHVHEFRAAAPSGRLPVHVVKPIIACVVNALAVLHSRNIIHADIKADNVLFSGPDTHEILETVLSEPPLIDGTFSFEGEQYPIMRSQPFHLRISWDVSSLLTESLTVVLSDLGVALWADQPLPPQDIGAFALRAPENIVRAVCDKKLDIWAIGCMAYELLAGQILFRIQPIADLIPDENLLLLQHAFTGQTLSKEVVEQSRVKEKYFDRKGVLIKSNPYARQTFKELLTIYCRGSEPELSEIQIDAAAKFIEYCLQLNPQDRPNVDELKLHRWLETAFLGGSDE